MRYTGETLVRTKLPATTLSHHVPSHLATHTSRPPLSLPGHDLQVGDSASYHSLNQHKSYPTMRDWPPSSLRKWNGISSPRYRFDRFSWNSRKENNASNEKEFLFRSKIDRKRSVIFPNKFFKILIQMSHYEYRFIAQLLRLSTK